MELSQEVKTILDRAERLARETNTVYLGVEHLLAAFLGAETPQTIALSMLLVIPRTTAQALEERLPRQRFELPLRDLAPTPRYELVMRWMWDLARATKSEEVNPYHLLLAVLIEGGSWSLRCLTQFSDLNLTQMVMRLIEAEREFASPFNPSDHKVHFVPYQEPSADPPPSPERRVDLPSPAAAPVPERPPSPSTDEASHAVTSASPRLVSFGLQQLSAFGRNLTDLAAAGRLRAPAGRDELMRDLARALVKLSRNNVLLLGDPGVGKTAVVEGLALRLLEPDLEQQLQGRVLIELNAGNLIAGTKYRGEMEERVREILDGVRSHPEVILFIDEFHQIVHGGETEGGHPGLKDLLLPALGRGELSLIAATTSREFALVLEPQQALMRRFEVLRVEEPTPATTLSILESICPHLEKHHHVRIADRAMRASILLTVRHLPERRLPDKAYDVLDQACARRRLRTLRDAEAAGTVEISASDVAEKVAELTGIPLERLVATEGSRLRLLSKRLGARVFGQAEAVATVTRIMKTALTGLSPRRGPLGVLLFAGPSGVGKTELAKALAEALFDNGKNLIRIDLSEYGSEESLSRLVGAAPGLLGHHEEGQLSGQVRRRPYSVVLLDEIEKAHAKVFDLLLQVFDEGRLTDGSNRVVDFKNTVILMTSNLPLGTGPSRRGPIGFGATPDASARAPGEDDDEPARRALRERFRPELVGRIEAIVQFQPLDHVALCQIVELLLAELNEDLRIRRTSCYLTQAALDLLARRGFDPMSGARSARRVFARLVREPVAERIVEGALRPGELLHGDVVDDELRLEVRTGAEGTKR